MRKLQPSRQLNAVISKYSPLPQEEIVKVVLQFVKTKKQKDANIILNNISRLFVKQIYKNESSLISILGPDITFDDIFNEMTVAIFKFIDRFNPQKSKFHTWATNALWPMLKQPTRYFRRKFDNENTGKMVDIFKPVGNSDSGATIADLLADGSPSVEKQIQKQLEDEIQSSKLNAAISKLKPQEQQIIKTLFGFIPPKKQWTKTLKDGSTSVNAVTIGKGLGIEGGRMRGLIAKMMRQLRDYLIEQNYDRYYAFDRLIEMYSGRKRFNKSRLLNRKDWDLI